MENRVGIRELKQNASAVVALAKEGNTVTITEHGKPAAILIPYPESQLEQLIAEGVVTPGTGSFDFSNIKPVKLEGLTIAELLDQSRAEDH